MAASKNTPTSVETAVETLTEGIGGIPAQSNGEAPIIVGSVIDQRAAALSTANGKSFAELLSEATATVAGSRVVQPEDLRGVPFIVTHARFHAGKGGDFVSLECVAADTKTLALYVAQGRTHIRAVDLLPVTGEERFVINDGSTGIRRQMVEFLHSTGAIKVDETWDFAAAEKTSVFDQPKRNRKEEPVWLSGAEEAETEGFEVRLLCPRGTRVSEYQYGGDAAMTVYLA